MINDQESVIDVGSDEERDYDEDDDTTVINPSDPLSRSTMDRSLAAKMYIEQYYINAQQSVKDRGQRRKDLEQKLENMKLSSKESNDLRKELDKKESDHLRIRRLKLKRSDFELIKIIGRGAFGEVSLVRHKESNDLYAMKRLKKSEMLKKEQVAHIRAERDVLASANTNWVVKLYYSFQDENYLYLIMEYLPGGDMMSLLIKYDIFTENQARFYIAETILAIESVHSLGYIHRDIKPDNLLLDSRGHVKLCDLGLCTGFHRLHSSEFYQMLVGDAMTIKMKLIEATPLTQTERIASWKKARRALAYSAVGTPDYTAPEVFLQVGYGKEVDWWSLGVILYEMVVGHPPFLSDNTTETCLKILNCKETLQIPTDMGLSKEVIDLIKKLVCEKDRYKTADEIKLHPFFKGINWENIRNQNAPFVPELKSPTDTSNFDDYEELEEDDVKITTTSSNTTTPTKKSNIIDKRNIKDKDLAFIGFTYKGFDAQNKSPNGTRKNVHVESIFATTK
ncbi:hypothetical protein DICPUDRAFT_50393 [Dictyostelium purpureum]|uniref:non-specific serine/threonine protein kinase n=1 Tax=Dictyostelium purpureum TaxID=5786 RepID=F0ZY86_DICPU|nr:uncharacterized protein DICPUDRAFT_50393 [Dictyostelium purpureum]EGC31099.1 hypothetical protein DICPUDRAFT_50393 [Dictyostelium purpureum]|eukprot:XP_003292376.1 hypothetical protein DICPUDRAFT_50393 [Dictyostelium purpureum]